MTAEAVLEEIIRCCEKHLVKEAVLFGSRAKGTFCKCGRICNSGCWQDFI